MHALFLVADNGWNASSRAFVLAARGLAARGHDVALACATDCPVQVNAQAAGLPVVAMRPRASSTGEGWRLRETLREREIDAVFVHTDSELLTASSAVRFARGGGGVIRRVPPFATASRSRRARLATRLAPAGLLFTTEADRDAASDAQRFRLTSAIAPLAVHLEEYDAVRAAPRTTLRAPQTARVIVCVQDGTRPQQAFGAIRTISLLASRHPELQLVIVGDGPIDELRMHGAALGVNTRITYLGARDDELSIIRAADVGWIAADGDAAAFAALDCMAFGIPLIAERSALSEHYVIDGVAGILLPTSDAPTMTSIVASFLARNDQRVQMGQAGRTRLVREFAYDAMVAGYEQAMTAAAGSAVAGR